VPVVSYFPVLYVHVGRRPGEVQDRLVLFPEEGGDALVVENGEAEIGE